MTTTTSTTNKPAAQLRDGTIKATIWQNPTADGNSVRYSVDLIRSYRDKEGNWRDTGSFSGSELLRVARLAGLAYDRIVELKLANRDNTDAEGDE